MRTVFRRTTHFSIIFILLTTWIPKGGVIVRYPSLDRYLSFLEKQSHEVYEATVQHSVPAALCGVKAEMKSNLPQALAALQFEIISVHALPFSLFHLDHKISEALAREIFLPSDKVCSFDVVLPPPRIFLFL